jgi:AcrR family transcriptional regulator
MSEVMTSRPRADAARNRERLLAAAKRVFSAGDAKASLEAVARAAGVGIGTLYRHFPTRESLYEAVYRREVDELAALADKLKSEATPDAALRRWVEANIDFFATKKGMAAALALAAHNKDLTAYSFDRLTRAVGGLLDHARSAGALRVEVKPEDLLRALVGMCVIQQDQPDWRKTVVSLMNVFLDGLLRSSAK